jgi:hypothetical protein
MHTNYTNVVSAMAAYAITYTGIRHVILAKHWLWLPDDGLCKPKHVGATFIILIVLII